MPKRKKQKKNRGNFRGVEIERRGRIQDFVVLGRESLEKI